MLPVKVLRLAQTLQDQDYEIRNNPCLEAIIEIQAGDSKLNLAMPWPNVVSVLVMTIWMAGTLSGRGG